jgi:hypothetical protein
MLHNASFLPERFSEKILNHLVEHGGLLIAEHG